MPKTTNPFLRVSCSTTKIGVQFPKDAMKPRRSFLGKYGSCTPQVLAGEGLFITNDWVIATLSAPINPTPSNCGNFLTLRHATKDEGFPALV
jgi:hypothetical protein